MPLKCARLDDLGDLADCEPQLVVGVVVVRPQAETRIGPEVAEDLPLGELLVDGLELGRADGDSAAAPRRIARTADLEPGRVEQIDQQLRLAAGVLAGAPDRDT